MCKRSPLLLVGRDAVEPSSLGFLSLSFGISLGFGARHGEPVRQGGLGIWDFEAEPRAGASEGAGLKGKT